MSEPKKAFLDWLKNNELPTSEIDHNVAKENKLKFDNHAPNADDTSFISKEKLIESFTIVTKSSY